MTPTAQAPSVAILLCTHNGQQFLAEQLDSIARQTHTNWGVWASDDNSTDGTREILQRYRSLWGPEKLAILDGPCVGSSANFLSLACNSHIQADYYSYADQDDIWEPHKLARAIVHLASTPQTTPALYASRTMLIDNAGREMGLSGLRRRPPSFKNALVQNIAGGNTMVFNNAARDILLGGGPNVRVVVHDWWTYMAVSGAGGVVFNDPAPSLKYRQHDGNQIGSNHGLAARIVRAIRLLQGGFRQWTDINMNALPAIEAHLTPENRQLFRQFCAIRAAPLVPRLIGLFRSGIYRQTLLDNLGLYLAAALNRL